LSTGVNPVPYPIGLIEPSLWERLPQGAAIAALEEAAARAYGVPDAECVVAAAGAQAIIQVLPYVRPARRVAVLGFAYAEHAQCWRRAGASVETIESLEEAVRYDALVVVNPNNPDGRLVPLARMQETSRRLAARGAMTILDESFIDVTAPQDSLATVLAEGLVILRSFGKSYGLAGLRLGFALAKGPMAGALREALGPWPVCGPAAAIGARALGDAAWLAGARRRLALEAERLDILLHGAGLEVVGGTPLFRLVRHPDAHRLFDRLGEQGILARAFTERPDLLRFGLPGAEREWSLLERRLMQRDL